MLIDAGTEVTCIDEDAVLLAIFQEWPHRSYSTAARKKDVNRFPG